MGTANRAVALLGLALCCAAIGVRSEEIRWDGPDGYAYVLKTGLVDDLRTWQDAKSYCNGVQFNGQPSLLSPGSHPPLGSSAAAISTLCGSRLKTCWLGEEPIEGAPGERLCPLVTASGERVFQGCEQIVSFVCRSAGPVTTPASPAASNPVPAANPTPSPALAPISNPTPVPTPVPTPRTDGSDVSDGPAAQKSFRGLDGRTYTLFFLGAQRTYYNALSYCQDIGQELSVYNTASLYAGDAAFAVKLLCSRSSRTTCWLGEQTVARLCPMIDQAGDVHYQDCGQTMAFVCRTILSQSVPGGGEEGASSDPTPQMLAPTPVRSLMGADGRKYTLYSGPEGGRRPHRKALDYCMQLGQELSPYDKAPFNPMYAGDAVAVLDELCGAPKLTCWYLGASADGLCNILSGADNKVYLQGCNQLVSFVCRTVQPIVPPDMEGGPDNSNDPGQLPEQLVDPPATVTYVGPTDGRTYTLYRGDAPNRRTYAGAQSYCDDLGQELVPYNRRFPDGDSVAAVRQLCGSARTTCWVSSRQVVVGAAQYCPLVSQDIKVQWQLCTQEINFVCRTKAQQQQQPARRMMLE